MHLAVYDAKRNFLRTETLNTVVMLFSTLAIRLHNMICQLSCIPTEQERCQRLNRGKHVLPGTIAGRRENVRLRCV